jgi:DNA polymerase III subunit delta'
MPFRDITGHRRLLDLLARSIGRGTLPQSLIFAGPSHIGKRVTAVAVAQALNCLQPPEITHERADACGRCAACVRIARGVHPDVLVVEPGDSGSIKIDHVRDIVDRAAYRPFEGRRRVVIVDEADALVPAAQNALLKTLEEPPPSSTFILVTARPDMLLATVRSRCIRLGFAAGGARHDDDREACAVAQRVLAHAAATTDAAKRLDGAKTLLTKTGAGGASDREQLAWHLRAMASLLRDVEVLATRADPRVLANPEVKPALERLASVYRGDRGVRAFTAIDQALVALDRNAGVKVLADWVMLQL